MQHHTPEIIIKRSQLAELTVVAVVLAFAVNLAAGVTERELSETEVSVVAVLLLALVAVYLFARNLRSLRTATTFEGFVLIERHAGRLVPVQDYELADDSARRLDAAFAENPALETQWRRKREVAPDGDRYDEYPGRDKLLSELVESVALSFLSSHLDESLRGARSQPNLVATFNRKDLPDVLLSNRFIELFSRPPQDRPAFADEEVADNVYAIFMDGAHFERLELVLPAGSEVTRSQESGALRIESPLLSAELLCRFPGHATMPPEGTLEFGAYRSHAQVTTLAIEFSFSTRPRWRALFSRRKNLQYYSWAEEFGREAWEQFSSEAFRDRTGIEQANIVLSALLREGHLPKLEGRLRKDRDAFEAEMDARRGEQTESEASASTADRGQATTEEGS